MRLLPLRLLLVGWIWVAGLRLTRAGRPRVVRLRVPLRGRRLLSRPERRPGSGLARLTDNRLLLCVPIGPVAVCHGTP